MSSNINADLSPINEDNDCGDIAITCRPSNLGNIKTTRQHTKFMAISDNDSQFDQYQHGLGFEIASSMICTLIRHPCIVLRRQCQVNRKSLRCHLSPFTLIPIVVRLQNRQGLKILWKGTGGIFILRGIAVGVETIIAEITPFPREISAGSSFKNIIQHLLLKSFTFGILTPFYCSSLIETVQSDIASETPGVFDCLREGIRRLLRWGTPQSTRLLPMWQLFGPTVAHGLLNYVISSILQYFITWIITIQLERKYAKYELHQKGHLQSASLYLSHLKAAYLGQMIAEVVLFPAETVLNRLYLQGTRTIIDNLDNGSSVIPVISKYEGAIDCFHSIIAEEGYKGLYKGFGALVLEYSMQLLILKLATFSFSQLANILSTSKVDKAKI